MKGTHTNARKASQAAKLAAFKPDTEGNQPANHSAPHITRRAARKARKGSKNARS